MDLRRWRRYMHFKQKEAALYLGLSLNVYNNYERGGGISFENLIKILHRGKGDITLEALARSYKIADKKNRSHIKESHLISLRKHILKFFKRN
ncbi:MAG: helix-turn-helix domain-containing protein [Promethearchaeota archaeon]